MESDVIERQRRAKRAQMAAGSTRARLQGLSMRIKKKAMNVAGMIVSPSAALQSTRPNPLDLDTLPSLGTTADISIVSPSASSQPGQGDSAAPLKM